MLPIKLHRRTTGTDYFWLIQCPSFTARIWKHTWGILVRSRKHLLADKPRYLQAAGDPGRLDWTEDLCRVRRFSHRVRGRLLQTTGWPIPRQCWGFAYLAQQQAVHHTGQRPRRLHRWGEHSTLTRTANIFFYQSSSSYLSLFHLSIFIWEDWHKPQLAVFYTEYLNMTREISKKGSLSIDNVLKEHLVWHDWNGHGMAILTIVTVHFVHLVQKRGDSIMLWGCWGRSHNEGIAFDRHIEASP